MILGPRTIPKFDYLLDKVVDVVETLVLVELSVVDGLVEAVEVFSCCFPGVGIFWLVVVGARVGGGGVASVVDMVVVDVVEDASRG